MKISFVTDTMLSDCEKIDTFSSIDTSLRRIVMQSEEGRLSRASDSRVLVRVSRPGQTLLNSSSLIPV